MTQPPKRANSRLDRSDQDRRRPQPNKSSPEEKRLNQPQQEDITTQAIIKKIQESPKNLSAYKIRDLVEDTKEFGKLLAQKNLKTNQIRKFLDAINRFKIKYYSNADEDVFEKHKDELHIIRYHLVYAAACQASKKNDPGSVEPLKKVLDVAIQAVEKREDFERLVQLIESIIAYHKAEGGKDQ